MQKVLKIGALCKKQERLLLFYYKRGQFYREQLKKINLQNK